MGDGPPELAGGPAGRRGWRWACWSLARLGWAGPWRIGPTHEDEAPVSFSSCLRRTGKMQGTAAPEVNDGAAATPAGEGGEEDRRGTDPGRSRCGGSTPGDGEADQ